MSFWTVVLDDDPTGTQGLARVPVIVRAAPETFDWALGAGRGDGDVVYVSTNTRALHPDRAAQLIAEVVRFAREAATRHGRVLRFVSRGDSTLRGHFPLEVQAVLAGTPDHRPRGCLLVPAFPAAGRVTLDGVHLVESGGRLVPVAETEYARDATFGFAHSALTDWARERIPPTWSVVALGSDLIDRGAEAVAAFLVRQQGFTVVCPSVRDEQDLAVLAEAQRRAEQWGVDYIVQAGPAYPRHLAGLEPARPAEMTAGARGGLVVVGSHTSTTTAQLRDAQQRHELALVELDVTAATGEGRAAEIDRCVLAAVAALEHSSVVLATSRERIVGDSAAGSLALAGRIASAIVEVTRAVLAAGPAFLVAKGGITSRDAVADSLGWDAATVVGPLVDQTLPVWRSWRAEAHDPPLVIFPGNVGSADLLTRALDRLIRQPRRRTNPDTERTGHA